MEDKNDGRPRRLLSLALIVLSAVIIAAGVYAVKFFSDNPGLSELFMPAGNAECVSGDRYVHNTLGDERQEIYDRMLEAIMDMSPKVFLPGADGEDVEACYHAICADYGEIFWVEKCSYQEVYLFGKIRACAFEPQYLYTSNEVDELVRLMRPEVDAYLEALAGLGSDYEKTEALYAKLAGEVEYDVDAENSQNILSVFLDGRTVCQGYASAVQYILQQAGVQCAIITGTAQGRPHAWNLALLDGDYYYIDVTWGNADYMGEKVADRVNYGYLNVTTDELSASHEPSVDFPLPECDSIRDNYFARHGLYFQEWDADAIGEVLAGAYEDDAKAVSVKFSSGELLGRATQYYIEGQHIADYCEGLSQIYYVQDLDMDILTVYF